MLAKMWKKVLLAICIIACIYNIMSKLVNRGSLEANLNKANDGNTVFDFSSKKSEQEIVDGVVSDNTTSTRNTIKINTNAVDAKVSDDEEVENEETDVTNSQTETEEQEAEEKKSSTVNFKDFIFNW